MPILNIKQKDLEQLAQFIRSKVSIEEAHLEMIVSCFSGRTVQKGQAVLRKGQIANQYFFIRSGGLRFCHDAGGGENTSWVIFRDEFFTEVSSLIPQKPTRFTIEAIEDTDLFLIDRKEMDMLYKQFPAWQEFGRKLWESMSVRMVDRIISFQTLSAEDRYLEFMRTPELIQKVPVKHLATYLGITPNALSRIRKGIR